MYLTEVKKTRETQKRQSDTTCIAKTGGETNTCADLGAANHLTEWIPIGFENNYKRITSGVLKVITI
jgi:hypothetical protein